MNGLASTPSVSAPRAEARAVIANFLYRGGSLAIEKASRLLLVVWAAPLLGEAAFGGYQFALTVTALLAVGADLGLSLWTTRALARDRDRAPAIVGTGLALRVAAAGPFLLAVGIAAALSARGPARDTLALLGAAALANAFIDYFGAIFRGFERLRDEGALNVVRALLVTGAGLTALRFGGSVTALAAGLLAGTLASAAFGLRMVHRRVEAATGGARRAFDRSLARAALAEAAPIWIATLLSLVYFKIDVVIVRGFVGDAELGAYSAAYKVFEAVMILPSVVMAAAFSPLARVQRDPRRRNRWEIVLASLLLGLGVFVGAVLYLWGDWIVGALFGAGFARAVPSLRLLALAVPVMFLNAGLIQFLIARGLEWRNLVLSALLLVINLGTNLAVVPGHGGPGAAFATGLTELALAVGCLLALRLGRDSVRARADAGPAAV